MATRISGSYLLKRIGVSVVILWAILTLLFVLLKALPGDFTTLMIQNPNLPPETVARVRAQYGLDDPFWLQYLKFVRNYLMLDFGYASTSPVPVAEIIFERLPHTLVLFGSAFFLQFTIGILTGINFGWNRGTRTDKSGFVTGLTLYSIPFFWLAWMLLLVFAYQDFGVTWLPLGHMTPSFQSEFSTVDIMVGLLKHMVLPVVSLTVVGWAATMLVMRTSMQEVLGEEYVRTARAKGLSPTVVKYKHAARNALIPVMTGALIAVVFIIDGAVIVETVFSWPGMGLLLIQAIQSRDFPVAMGAFFMLGVLIVVMRLVTDIAYTYLDPRIKFGEAE